MLNGKNRLVQWLSGVHRLHNRNTVFVDGVIEYSWQDCCPLFFSGVKSRRWSELCHLDPVEVGDSHSHNHPDKARPIKELSLWEQFCVVHEDGHDRDAMHPHAPQASALSLALHHLASNVGPVRKSYHVLRIIDEREDKEDLGIENPQCRRNHEPSLGQPSGHDELLATSSP